MVSPGLLAVVCMDLREFAQLAAPRAHGCSIPEAGARIRAFLSCSAILLVISTSGREARAAGCHVPDRPRLQSRFSWESELIIDTRPAESPSAPLFLSRTPCDRADAHQPQVSRLSTPPACFEWRVASDAQECERLPVATDRRRPTRIAHRLHRPPRLV